MTEERAGSDYVDLGYPPDTARLTASSVHPVRRAANACEAAVQDVRIDHCGADVAVSQELLHGSDVAVALEQVVANEWRNV